MVDTRGLGPRAVRRESSSLSSGMSRYFFKISAMKKLLLLLVVIGLVYYGAKMMKDKPEEVVEETPAVAVDLSTLEDGDYALDTSASTLTYTGKKVIGSHTGTVDLKSGSLTFAEKLFTGGNFVIDMSTITESKKNETFVNHTKSEDFFDIEKFPEASFTISSIEQKTDNFVVTGDLTILDKTNEITFDATLSGSDTLNAKTSFEIDRTKWGITYGSGSFFDNLGDNTINDQIEFDLDLTFKK